MILTNEQKATAQQALSTLQQALGAAPNALPAREVYNRETLLPLLKNNRDFAYFLSASARDALKSRLNQVFTPFDDNATRREAEIANIPLVQTLSAELHYVYWKTLSPSDAEGGCKMLVKRLQTLLAQSATEAALPPL